MVDGVVVDVEIDVESVAVADGVACGVSSDGGVVVAEAVVVQADGGVALLGVGESVVGAGAGFGNDVAEGFVGGGPGDAAGGVGEGDGVAEGVVADGSGVWPRRYYKNSRGWRGLQHTTMSRASSFACGGG